MSFKKTDAELYSNLLSDINSVTIGIVGAGKLGSNMARLCANAGLKVLVSNSREPESLSSLVNELNDKVTAFDSSELAKRADIIILCVPYTRVGLLPIQDFSNKIIIDATNYISERDGVVLILDNHDESASEHFQIHLPLVRFVKAFNNIPAEQLISLSTSKEDRQRTALPIASDDFSAFNIVATLIEQLGFDTLFTGSLKNSWRHDQGSPAFAEPYFSNDPIICNELRNLLSLAQHEKIYS